MTDASDTTTAIFNKPSNAEEGNEKVRSGSGSSSGSEDGPTEKPQKEDLYFYLFDKDSVVIEFEAPSDEKEKEHERPEFLYNPIPGRIRIVEFYAHWCPHCIHFRDHFNKFAKKMKEIAKQTDTDIDIYAVSCTQHRPLCNDWDVHGYPRIKLFVGNTDDDPITIKQGNVHPFFLVKTIAEKTGKNLLSALDGIDDKSVKDHGSTGDKQDLIYDTTSFWLPRSKRDIYNDIFLSFHFAMEHSVFVGKDPPDEYAREAFRDWIMLLNRVLPPTWNLLPFVSEIAENIDTVLDKESNLMTIVNKHPPPKRTWSKSCSRDNKGMGYTCGLWELFHTVTIGTIEWNLNGVWDTSYAPEEVASIFRSYIQHFFGCEVCRTNFLQEYDSCAFNRCNRLLEDVGELKDWKELPLWLFEFHNGVNLRLLKEKGERENRTPSKEEIAAVEWPSRTDCPSCWLSDGRFDAEITYAFLQKTYWPNSLISHETPTEQDVNSRIESWVYSLVGFLIASFVLSAVAKQNDIQRTGKHKKVDDCDDDMV